MGATRMVLDRLALSLDQPDELEFHEIGATLPGAFHSEQAVTLTDGSTTLFAGWIFKRSPDGFGVSSGRVGYRCLGLSYGAALIAVTAADGTGTMAFNLPSTDPYYSANEAGLSVGTIISQVIVQHSTQLTAIGVSTDSTTTSQLAALMVVSPDPVYISGNSLWVQLQQFLMQWYGSRYCLRIEPSGLVRCWDTFSLTVETITLDSDPAVLVSMSEDTSESYTQVVLRGRDDVEAAFFSLHDNTLIGEQIGGSGPGWTAAQQAAWDWSQFAYPQNGYDQGTITALTSTVVTIQSDYATAHWATNFWDGIQGTIAVINPIITGLGGFQEVRHVTANSAMTAGGTCTITLDRPLASSGYTRYQMVGYPIGLSQVWRKYVLSNPYVAEHLVQQFNFGVPFQIGMGNTSLVTTPIAAIEYTQAGITQIVQVTLQIVPFDGTNPGYVLMNNPVVQFTSTQAQLNAGGSSVVAPSDVIVMVPYSRGALTVTSPSGGGYAGTAYSLFGVQRTLYRDYPNWIDAGNTSNMQTLADNIAVTVDNAIQEGSITYLDKYTNALPSGNWPIALNIAKATGTTGYESMAAPVRSVELVWPQDGAAIWVTHLSFSTRRQMYSGDRLYVHAMYASGGFGEQMAGTIGGGVNHTGEVVNAPGDQEQAPEMQFGDMGQGGYIKPSERRAAGVAGKRRRDREASDSKDRQEAAIDEADKARRDAGRGTRLDTTEADRDQIARGNDLANPERQEAIGQAVQSDNARRARRMRGSDQSIVSAHESAYGKHDSTQDIVDAHQSAYGDTPGDAVAENDKAQDYLSGGGGG